MKISQKVVSIIFLFLMTIIVLGVLTFYYFSLENLVSCSPVLQEKHISSKAIEFSFFSHDVLNARYLCKMDEKWPASYASIYEKECFDSSDYDWENKLLVDGFNYNKILFINEILDYRIILDEDMAIFQDIKKKIKTHDDYFIEIVSRGEARNRYTNPMELQAIFDRQKPGIVYILFSFNDQVFWGPDEWGNLTEDFNPEFDHELVAYSAEIAVYKYDLLKDDFEILYNAYEIVDNELGKELASNQEKLIAPANLLGIDDENNLIISGSGYYGITGLGGGDIVFNFEKLSAWHDFYLLKSGTSKLEEYKYNKDENSYNADLFQFLMFEYYPKHFNMDEFIDTDIYREF